MAELIWSPTASAVEARIAQGDRLILIFSPFIKAQALRRLFHNRDDVRGVKFVCRWSPKDFVAGATDLDVFSFVTENECELYSNESIHLKLFVFHSNVAFTTSGNMTLRGMGYADPSNVETGAFVALSRVDWEAIYQIITASYRVDQSWHDRLAEFLQGLPPAVSLPAFANTPRVAKKFTISSLPATLNPLRLKAYYFGDDKHSFSREEVRRAAHDIITFRVPAGLAETEFHTHLREAFLRTPFIHEFLDHLRPHKSLRFGAVNDWIHEMCEDVPLPYRWEVKDNTRILYDWLTYFVPEVTWDVPSFSQVIYWTSSAADSPATDDPDLASLCMQFAQLENREQAIEWQTVSRGRAPHQPILLLVIIKLYDLDPERNNFVRLDPLLDRLFREYFATVVQSPRATSIPMPFIALRHEPFWNLIPRDSVGDIPSHIRSQAAFDRYYEGVKLSVVLHRVLRTEDGRRSLEATLLGTYFPEPAQSSLRAAISNLPRAATQGGD